MVKDWLNCSINEFEKMKDIAELKALSKYSLENVPTDKQYNRMLFLRNKVLGREEYDHRNLS